MDIRSEERINRDLSAANFANLFIIFTLGLSLILLWYTESFRNSKYNTLSLLFGIWIIIWVILLINVDYEAIKYNFHIPLFPECVNCIIPLNRCEDGGFELATIFHFFGYMIIGIIVPDLYFEILILSVLFEIFESIVQFTPKIILDPIVNILGYALGSLMNHSK